MIRFSSRLLLVLVVAASASAQCPKPPIPSGGLTTTGPVDVAVTYSDGYKTLCNLTIPTGAPPRCGWPLVVFIHGYGGRRSSQRGIASRGFAVLAPDVRGQGTAKTLNPRTMGMTFYGATEKYDLAELVAFARNKWKGIVSQTKLAVTGASQGGIHSWFAAAYSGRKITIAGRGTITFPTVSCVAPQNFTPDVIQHSVRGGTLFSVDAINRAFGGNTAAVLDANLVKQIGDAFLKQDPVGLNNWMNTDPNRAVMPLLKSTTVPVLYAHAWFDGIQSPLEAVRGIESMPATTPVRAHLSTIGHGSTLNTYELQFRNEERIRWFDRYLWDIKNGVETDAPAVMGVVPLDSSLTNRATAWEHRHDASHAPASMRRYFLRADKTLGTTNKVGAGAPIVHKVAATYTPQFVRQSPANWRTGTILANVPLSQQVYRMAPLDRETELAGRPRVDLTIVPGASRFHLAVLLMARIPGQTVPRMLAIQGYGEPKATQQFPMRVRFALSPTYCVLPKGTRLEVVVRNHWLREFPMPRAIVTMPYFVSGTHSINHGGPTQSSSIELPFRAARAVGLIARSGMQRTMATNRAVDYAVQVRGGAAAVTKPYIVAVGVSGHTPKTPLPGGALPLRWDPLTDAILSLTLAKSTLVPGFLGSLNTNGAANATLRLSTLNPLPAVLAGHRLSFAAWVYSTPTNLTGRGSNPLDVVFR